jgi:hypothetical protein
MRPLIRLTLAACIAVPSAFAQAGIIEDLLAVPAIQSLLGRLPELPNLVRNCQDAGYKQRNLAFCQQAEQAALLAKMPIELRAVMARKDSADSLRELCVAAIGKLPKESYLCAELYKYDSDFQLQSRQMQQQQILDRQMR